jgi:excisionase family DNA binding protein
MRIKRKLTIDELAERLALSRSTVYYWVRDLPIPGSGSGGGWPEGAQRKGARSMQRKFRLLREEAYREGSDSFDELSVDQTFRDFVCLYIAEGYKRSRNTVSICNSDPAVMWLATKWIRCLSVKCPVFGIQYHADQDVDALRAFWGRRLVVDPSTIRLQRKSNSNQLAGRSWRSPHGVVRHADSCATTGLDGSPEERVEVESIACGVWRSLVARGLWVAEVPGSNPGAPIQVDMDEQSYFLVRAGSGRQWGQDIVERQGEDPSE